ncbi:polynucleotide 5'-hydroxyl-kinase NOL9 [Drosophila mojavensis]|uniref:Polynucleotide 5'-hydroxyl-kinase NOL9 n=1 Tax=Drosophila mojavensis TaxID=7230 RepID=B4KQB2_DROMO|nr:polynucleotide 5'-hydroxyl-kinase NOL9 [Drosophila mojavensis]EDW09240.2 uncharacterized protein Dmoj_GI20408 [Drosophila mojavensis]
MNKMTIKRHERVRIEIQSSFKLTENRIAKSQAPLVSTNIWKTINYKPKVAICNPPRIEEKTTATQKAPNTISNPKMSEKNLNAKLNSIANLDNKMEMAAIANAIKRKTQNVPVKAINKRAKLEIGSTQKGQLKTATNRKQKPSYAIKKSKKIGNKNVTAKKNTNSIKMKRQSAESLDGEKAESESESDAELLDEEESQSESEEESELIDTESMDKEESESLGKEESGSESDAESMEEDESGSKCDESESDGESLYNETLESKLESGAKSMDEEESESDAESMDEQKSESKSESDAELMDEEEATSELNSDSDYSWDSDKNFFLQPGIIKAKLLKPIKIDFDIHVKKVDEPLCITEAPVVDVDLTKVSVFDGMMDKAEPETQNFSAETVKDEALSESDDEAEGEKEPVEMSENSVNNDEEDIEMQLLPTYEGRITSPWHNIPEFTPDWCVFENSFKTNNVLAVVKQDIELYGTVTLTLLSGRITINGYKPRRDVPLTIYSPKGFNWVAISPMSNMKPIKSKLESNSSWKDLEDSFTRAQLDHIKGSYDEYRDAIVLMQRNSGAQNMLHIIGKHMVEKVFPMVNTSNRPYASSEYILNCLIQSADAKQTLRITHKWMKLKLQPRSRWMVAGGKGVGKSTLLRFLLNRHLSRFERILFIDLDIGQPEFFLPQTISCFVIDGPLLGAGFFFNKQPERAYAVGHVNVVMCAEQYIRAVRELLFQCKVNPSYDEMPWLINTMGYNKGFGRELMALLIDCVQPTDLIQISSPKAINNFEITLNPKSLAKVRPIIYTADEFKVNAKAFSYKLHQLESVLPQLEPEHHWRMSPKDVRYANLLARLSSALNGNAKYLTDCQPVSVDLDAVKLVHLVSKDYVREELIAGMEANLVYLCKGRLDDDPKECLGIGVVRAIDYEEKKLYLVPAMPLERLSQVNCLVLGTDMCLPQGFFKDQGAGVANNVPFVFIIDDNKSSKSIQQIYFRPGFMRQPKNPKTNTKN